MLGSAAMQDSAQRSKMGPSAKTREVGERWLCKGVGRRQPSLILPFPAGNHGCLPCLQDSLRFRSSCDLETFCKSDILIQMLVPCTERLCFLLLRDTRKLSFLLMFCIQAPCHCRGMWPIPNDAHRALLSLIMPCWLFTMPPAYFQRSCHYPTDKVRAGFHSHSA